MLDKDDVVGDYKLEKFLGRGQFGEVWLAEKQLKFSTRKVRHALKFLSNSGEEIDLKAAEAEVDTWIEAGGHPNVMSVLDMLVHKNYIIIVSEFADGGSLKNWFDKDGKAPSQIQALEMMLGILRGIEHLHSKNVVHRDLKPDNILLQGNFPRITDFGISRIVGEGTMSTKPLGSPAYMSPESFDGNKSPQNDIWSAGVVLYEMLCGTYPFEEESIYGLITAIQRKEAKPLPENIPPGIKLIVETALQKDIKKRFQTAREMQLKVEGELYNLKAPRAEYQEITKKTGQPTPLVPSADRIEQPTLKMAFSEITKDPQKFLITDAPESITFEHVKSKTQPEIENITKTQPSQVEATQHFEELEPKIIHQPIADPENISNKFENESENRSSKQNRKMYLLAGGAVGSMLILLFAGFLIINVLTNIPQISLSKNTNTTNKVNDLKDAALNKKPNPPPGMAYVPGGEFMMGRDDGKSEDEKPAHKVTVNPYYMDVYETTNEQYAEFVKAINYKTPIEWKNGTYPIGQAKYPVVGVNWEDAKAYGKWAGKRLPTEEEWEFAARGKGNLLYPWGNNWQAGNANADGSKGFTEVGKFKSASPFGIYDLIGNAWEWTDSDFKAYPGGKLTESESLKTIRGGSFEATKDFATTTYRLGWQATGAKNYSRTGFRCVKDIE